VLCHHLVGFFDVLGQSNKLRELKVLPRNEEERARTVHLLKQTAGAVIGIRRMFKDYFDAAGAPTAFSRQLPDPARAFIQGVTAADVTYRAVSDSFIVTVSLGETDVQSMPISGVWRAFVAASGMWLLALSAGYPIRGGIDVGLAIRIDGDEVYGPAIACAYHLESKTAGGPRIVVGGTCVDYLNSVSSRRATDLRARIAAEMSGLCLSMLRRDWDGAMTLHPLGSKMLEISRTAGIGRQDNIAERVKPAHDAVRRELHEAEACGNAKLVDRYQRLLEYFDLHAGDWV
jgi:hypothetical protein